MATWWGTILATQHSRADRKFDNGKYSNNYFAKSVQVSAGRSVLIDLVSKGIFVIIIIFNFILFYYYHE